MALRRLLEFKECIVLNWKHSISAQGAVMELE